MIKNVISEGSSAFLTLTFKDQTGSAVTPTSAEYRLDNGVYQILDWTSFTPTSSTYILEITPTQNAIQDHKLETETMTVTVRWAYGSASQGTADFTYQIRNLFGEDSVGVVTSPADIPLYGTGLVWPDPSSSTGYSRITGVDSDTGAFTFEEVDVT